MDHLACNILYLTLTIEPLHLKIHFINYEWQYFGAVFLSTSRDNIFRRKENIQRTTLLEITITPCKPKTIRTMFTLCIILLSQLRFFHYHQLFCRSVLKFAFEIIVHNLQLILLIVEKSSKLWRGNCITIQSTFSHS